MSHKALVTCTESRQIYQNHLLLTQMVLNGAQDSSTWAIKIIKHGINNSNPKLVKLTGTFLITHMGRTTDTVPERDGVRHIYQKDAKNRHSRL